MPAPRSDLIFHSILDTIGNTPMIHLSRISVGLRPTLVAKVEYFNPGGSIKDRVALALIEAAEAEGKLVPGGTLVEPTSGNTGTGLAIAARLKGYRVIAVMPDKMSQEKIDLLRAYGAEVVVCPTAVEPDNPRSYYRVADRLAAEIPGAFQPNQYHNQANPEAHYRSTGPEIWRQTGGRITHLVAGIGTGGTITGVARYLKEQNPEIRVIGADPEGSIYSSREVHPYLLEGVGEDFWPSTFDPSVVDQYVSVSDQEAFLMTRRLAESEGLLVGGSCGMAVVAALKVGAEIQDPEALIVVILPDGGRAYLSKIFSDDWMSEHGMLERPVQLVGSVLRAKQTAGELPSLIAVSESQSGREAVRLFHAHGVSQLPVLQQDGQVIGSISERGLLARAAQHTEVLDGPVSGLLEPAFVSIECSASIDQAISLLKEERPAMLATQDGVPVGVLTRADLLEALSG